MVRWSVDGEEEFMFFCLSHLRNNCTEIKRLAQMVLPRDGLISFVCYHGVRWARWVLGHFGTILTDRRRDPLDVFHTHAHRSHNVR